MLTKRIVPCLDVDAGRVVKGTKFLNLRDVGDPVDLAERYEREGADELVLLDITAASETRAAALAVLRRAAGRVFIPVTLGGGMRSVADMRAALNAGADKVSVNSAAVERAGLITEAARAFGRRPVRCAGSRRAARRDAFWLGGSNPRRTPTHWTRRDCMDARGSRAWRGRSAADEHGPRRHPGGLRSGAAGGDECSSITPVDRVRRCGRPRASAGST